MTYIFLLIFQMHSFALTHNALSVGLGVFYENNLSRITSEDSGKKSFLGSRTFPLVFTYDYEIFSSYSGAYFFAPKLTTNLLLPREEDGDTGKVTNLHLILPIGMNFGATNWDWTAGLGILRRTFDDEGGVIQLNNGGSIDPFAQPGLKVSSQVVTVNLGTSYNMGPHSAGFDLISEGLFSDKRTWNFMLSYLYEFRFGYGYSSSSQRAPPPTRR